MSADKGFNIWVGEEDHLRIMCMQKGVLLNKASGSALCYDDIDIIIL
jgi:hypothetical protein